MIFNPISAMSKYDLVITTKEKLINGLSLMCEYQAKEYHRFEDSKCASYWLENQRIREKILFFCTKEDIRNFSKFYYCDRVLAKPIAFGIYAENDPKFFVGDFSVYMNKCQPYHFPA